MRRVKKRRIYSSTAEIRCNQYQAGSPIKFELRTHAEFEFSCYLIRYELIPRYQLELEEEKETRAVRQDDFSFLII
jgi:hypothetical protein